MAAGALVLYGDGDDGEGEAGERDLSVAAVLLDTSPMPPRQQVWLQPARSS
jgi:hypothetical protein